MGNKAGAAPAAPAFRALSNKWQVWTPSGRAPIAGRICMDMCMIDLTDLPQVGEGDEVEVYGAHAEGEKRIYFSAIRGK